jgi:putative membrane protein
MKRISEFVHASKRDAFYSQFDYPFFKLWGSVIPRVWIPVILLTLWSALITAIHQQTSIKLNAESLFLTLLNFTLGMILVFRNSAAYDRWWEGRRIWGQIITAVRNLGRFIWVHTRDASPQDIAEKKAGISCLMGYVVAIQNHLREEYSLEPLKPYIGHCPARQSAVATYADDSDDVRLITNAAEKPNNPLDIISHLAAFLTHAKAKLDMDPAIFSMAHSNLGTLVDSLSNLERIRRTPLPLAYTLHLTHMIWIDLILLPFQLLKAYMWLTIPVTLLVAFCILGIEAISREIENPFGYDENDLTVEIFVKDLSEELKNLSSGPIPKVTDWKISKDTDILM